MSFQEHPAGKNDMQTMPERAPFDRAMRKAG